MPHRLSKRAGEEGLESGGEEGRPGARAAPRASLARLPHRGFAPPMPVWLHKMSVPHFPQTDFGNDNPNDLPWRVVVRSEHLKGYQVHGDRRVHELWASFSSLLVLSILSYKMSVISILTSWDCGEHCTNNARVGWGAVASPLNVGSCRLLEGEIRPMSWGWGQIAQGKQEASQGAWSFMGQCILLWLRPCEFVQFSEAIMVKMGYFMRGQDQNRAFSSCPF